MLIILLVKDVPIHRRQIVPWLTLHRIHIDIFSRRPCYQTKLLLPVSQLSHADASTSVDLDTQSY